MSKRRYRHIAPVGTREELIYLLSRASELEHGLACVYLFAAYSLKGSTSEGGLSNEQLAAVCSWKRKLAAVAVEEMLHLAQVSNLLTAIGGAPHFRRTNFPLHADAFPFGIELSLEPFSQRLIERLVCYEMPERGVLPQDQQVACDVLRERVASMPRVAAAKWSRQLTEPFDIDFSTVGEFYHKIETGFRTIDEAKLFIGPPQAQASGKYLDLESIIPVVDRTSACAAIDMIIEQGEAPTQAHPDAHYCIFEGIRAEYEALVADALRRDQPFEPARPVVANPMTRFYDDTTGGAIIDDPRSHELADIFNTTYDTMLAMLLRFFAHAGESEKELRLLARGTLRMMASVLRPLGEALTLLPAGDRFPGMTAGGGFGYNRDVHLLAHKESAWVFFVERLWQLADRTTALCASGSFPPEVGEAAAAMQSVTEHLGALLKKPVAGAPAVLPQAGHNGGVSIRCEANGPYLVSNLTQMKNSKGETLGTRPALALCRCGGSALKPYCDGTHARIGFDSSKRSDRTADRLDSYASAEITILDNRGTCCHSGRCSDTLPQVFRLHAEPWIDPNAASKDEIISLVRTCPSGALSYTDGSVTKEHEKRAPSVYVSQDGPYHIQGGIPLEGEARNDGASLEHYALCRCGHSKNKPFCDGTHWYIKFRDEDN